MKINLAEIKNVDLSYMKEYYPDEYHLFSINSIKSGSDYGEHYKLLNYLSSLFNGGLLLDCGSRTGMSALALGGNRKNKVLSYDLIPVNPSYASLYPNITFKQQDVLTENTQIFLDAQVIFIDLDPHDGVQERRFFEILQNIGYKGLVVLDDMDTDVFPAMKEFWNGITQTKFNISKYGHGSGSGLVDFSGNIIVTE